MNCVEFERQIVIFSELTSVEQTRVTCHLRACKGCSEFFESVRYTNDLVLKSSKVTVELEDPFRLTNDIMTRIKAEESKRWSLFNLSFLKFEFTYVKYAMATLSLLLIVSFGMEQLESPINEVTSSKQAKKVVLNRKNFREELSKSKATVSLTLANSCKSPFNITKVNEDCVKQRMAIYKEL